MRPSALSLRSLLERLHPPSPITVRESEQLLARLKASFQRSLDQNHPAPRAQGTYQNVRRGPSPKETVLYGTSKIHQASPLVSTHQHVHALLSHPLLSMKPTGFKAPSSIIETESIHAVNQAETAGHDPMAWFDARAALGTASQELAAACLAIHGRAARSRAGPSVVQQMKDSGAGNKVLRWLWSKGRDYWHDAIHDQRFIRELVPFLVVESRHDVIWEWLRMPNDHESSNRGAMVAAKSHLLHTAMGAEQRYGGGPDKAVEHYLQAIRLGQAGSIVKPDQSSTTPAFSAEELKSFVSAGGRYFAALCMKAHRQGPSWRLSPLFLDRFCDTLHIWSHCPWYMYARIRLSAPPEQDPSGALSFLRDGVASPSKDLFVVAKDKLKSQRAIVRLGIDTAGRLIELGQLDDANWVMQFLKDTFPKQLNLDVDAPEGGLVARPARTSSSHHEQQSLELLDGLLPS